MIKLIKIGAGLYSKWSKGEGKSLGVFLTHKQFQELKDREKLAFEAGRELIKERIPRGAPVNVIACFEHKDFNDYLSSKSKEGAE